MRKTSSSRMVKLLIHEINTRNENLQFTQFIIVPSLMANSDQQKKKAGNVITSGT